MNFILISCGILLYFLTFSVRNDALRNWDFELLYVDAKSSDENLANVSSKLEQSGIGKQTLTAVIDWKFDVDEYTMFQMKIFSCQSGRDADYNELPYQIPNMTYYEFLDQYYMKVVYADFGSCSNIPDIGDKFVPPWNKTTFIFSKCDPQAVNYPDILPRGYYKMEFKILGQAEIIMEVIVKLKPRSFI